LNISKYAKPAPLLPREGMRVEVGLDPAGYVRAVHLVAPQQEDSPPGEAPGASELLYLNNEALTPAAERRTAQVPDRDTRIMRQAVLNTATAILGSGGRDISVADVLTLAARLEAWVSRCKVT
jgi:hypothetical protein